MAIPKGWPIFDDSLPADTHLHVCECGNEWAHKTDLFAGKLKFKEDHTCSECGALVTDKAALAGNLRRLQ